MKYKRGYRYHLQEDETFIINILPPRLISTPWYKLTPLGYLTLKAGFAWDGSSGKFTIQTPWCKRASAVHDAICDMIQCGLLADYWKTQGDVEYYRLCRLDGMPWPMAKWRLAAIDLYWWHKKKPNPILHTPKWKGEMR